MSIEAILFKHLVRSALYINSQPVKFRFWNNSKEREEGYTNSSFFETLKKGTIIGVLSPNINIPVTTLDFTYKIKEKMSAAAAVKDLVENKETQIVLTCTAALSLSVYNAILETFSEMLGNAKGVALFDQLFNGRLLIRDIDIIAGTTFFYGDCLADLCPLQIHPLSFFLVFNQQSFLKQMTNPSHVNLGDLVYFDNNKNYRTIHPAGTSRRLASLCIAVKDGQPLFSAFGRQRIFNCQEAKLYLAQQYNDVSHSVIDGSPASNRFKQIDVNDVPGLNYNQVYRLNTERLQYVIDNPDVAAAEFNRYLESEVLESHTIFEYMYDLKSLKPKISCDSIETANKLLEDAQGLVAQQKYVDANKVYLQASYIYAKHFCYAMLMGKKDIIVAFYQVIALTQYNLANSYEKIGDKFTAIKHLQYASALLYKHDSVVHDQNNQLTQDVLASLQRIRQEVYKEYQAKNDSLKIPDSKSAFFQKSKTDEAVPDKSMAMQNVVGKLKPEVFVGRH